MSVDYDLVILGGSPAGIYAARYAAQFHARVALIDQGIAPVPELPVFLEAPAPLVQWQTAVTTAVGALDSPAALAAAGIDVISGQGEFVRRPRLGVVVGDRALQSRAYLLATGTRPLIPNIPGLDAVPYHTVETLIPNWESLTPDQHVVILGDEPVGLAIAQALVRRQVRVTLIVSTATLLPEGDVEAVDWLQAHLEADGVTLLTATAVTQVRQIGEQIWLQSGDRAIAADLLLVTPRSVPMVAGLNLEAANVKGQAAGMAGGSVPDYAVAVNAKMQTSNPRIYACFGQWKHHFLGHYAVQQAAIAVENILFWPTKTVDQRGVTQLIPTTPGLLSVGLSEQEARQRYGSDTIVLRQLFRTVAAAQWQGAPTGFCKVMVRRRGEILGAQIAGPNAGELGAAIALAVRQKLKIQALATLVMPSLTTASILAATAQDWQQQRWQQQWRRDWLEEFFSWRRSRG